MDDRCPRQDRSFDAGHMVARVDVDEHLLGGVLRLFGRAGQHHRDRLADVSNGVPGQHRLRDRPVVIAVQ